MSNPLPRKTIERSLLAKGFSKQNRDHRVYCLYDKGKKTAVHTKISTGTGYKCYDDELFRLMKRQLHLDSVRQVRDLLACPMSKEEYVSFLRSKEVLSSK